MVDQRCLNEIDRLIRQLGVSITLRSIDRVYNVTTGKTTNVNADDIIFGIVENYDVNEIDGTSIQQGDLKITISESFVTEVPIPNKWHILLNLVIHQIVTVEKIYVGDAIVAYKLQART